jgi:hypothetical protein
VSQSHRAKRPSAPSVAATFAALILLTASAAANLFSALARHPDIAGKFVAGSVAIGASILTALAIAGAIRAGQSRNYTTAALCGVAFIVAAGYSTSNALGIIGGKRIESAAHSGHDADTRKRAAEARNGAAAEIAKTPSARPIGEIKSVLDGLLADPALKGCSAPLENWRHRQTCSEKVAPLKAELARSERLEVLAGKIAAADAILAKPLSATANADATVIGEYLAAFGLSIPADRIGLVITALAVLILECGSGLALAVASAFKHPPQPAAKPVSAMPVQFANPAVSWSCPATPMAAPTIRLTANLGTMPATPVQSAEPPVTSGLFGAPATIREIAATAILNSIRANGSAPASIRKLHKQLDVASVGTIHGVVAALVAAGAIARSGESLIAAGGA